LSRAASPCDSSALPNPHPFAFTDSVGDEITLSIEVCMLGG
jgi:hypothetical protein